MQLPVPPNKPDLIELHNYVISLNKLLQNLHLSGLQATQFTQAELNSMVATNQLSQDGKIFKSLDDNQFYGAINNAGTLQLKQFTVT